MLEKIQHALIYPTLMIIVSVSIISFLLAFVVPKIIEVFSDSGQTLPTMTIVLIFMSNFIKSYGLYLLLGIIILSIVFKWSLASPRIKLRWHRLMLHIPVVSYLTRSINVARYIHTFSILFAAGVSVLDTMKVSTNVVSNLIMRQAFEIATIRVKEGTSISAALKDSKYLGAMATHIIASGEKSGRLANMMERAAIHLDFEVQGFIETALTLLEPLVILIMGVVVLFIVLATLLPIFSMEQLVS